MPHDATPSAASLWLDEALTGWVLPVAGVLALAVAGGLYLAGLLSEGAAAALLAAVVALAAAVLVARRGLRARADRAGRALAVAAAAGTLALTAWPAMDTVLPGSPLFQGDLAAVGDRLQVPPDVSGHLRLLVNVPLPRTGAPEVTFRIAGPSAPVEGRLERTFSYSRVGRGGGRAAVAHDHSSAWRPALLPPGARTLELQRLSGEHAGPLHVAVHRDRFPPPLLVGLALLALALAAAAEARLGGRGGEAAVTGIALAFGLLVTFNATPGAAVGSAVGGLLLGVIAGAAVGAVAAVVARRIVPPAPPARGRAPA